MVCDSRGRCVSGDAGICDAGAPLTPTNQVDLLFVIDDTTRLEWQYDLVAEVPRLLDALARGGLPGAEGSASAVESFHLGVVTSDMGSGPDGACDSLFGDDGVLRTAGDTANPECMAEHPPWLTFGAGGLEVQDAATHAQCLISALGYQGCGFEQPLEATLKALTPGTSALRFSENTVGHGDGANEGFLREGSLLAIIALGDEDDCSAHDTALYDLDDPRFGLPGDTRCLREDALHPVSRYVDGLLALREDPRRVFYGVLGGIPADAVPSEVDPLEPQLVELLGDPRMESRPSELDSTQLAPSCDRPGEGRAYPPERMVGVARGLADAGAAVWVDSACRDTLTDPIDRIASRITAALAPTAEPTCE